MGPARTRLVVLFGGRSAEHDVSRVTASHVLRAVDPARYEIVAVGIGRDGRWQLAETAMTALEDGPESVPDALPVDGPPVDALPVLTAPEAHDGGGPVAAS